MKLKLITPFFIVILLFSCKQQYKVLQYDGISKDLILSIESTNRSLFDSVKYIKLETTDDCLIGRISQILFTDSLLVVVDSESANAVYVFDTLGKFRCKIGAVGQGPGEYVSLWHVTLKPDKQQIVIEDIIQHKILYFNYSGKFEYSERTPFMLSRYEYLANGYKAFDVSSMKDPAMGELQENTLIVTDENNNVIYGACTDFYDSEKFTYVMHPALRKFGDKLYYSPNYSNEIYEITDTAAILKYTLNIPNGMPPLYKGITGDIFHDYEQKYNIFDGDYIELEDFTCITLMHGVKSPLVIYSHAKEESYLWDFPHLLFLNEVPIARYKDNWLVFERSAFDIMDRKQLLYELAKETPEIKQTLDEIYDGLTDESNPVIFFYHLNPNKFE
ncbi:MAG: 6-bladed beta-propeller [Prevotellaceae bacterium]|jgi:hypothetical protein|nr:6-bladed beta-propeller [Prevotellaceae bacterium]